MKHTVRFQPNKMFWSSSLNYSCPSSSLGISGPNHITNLKIHSHHVIFLETKVISLESNGWIELTGLKIHHVSGSGGLSNLPVSNTVPDISLLVDKQPTTTSPSLNISDHSPRNQHNTCSQYPPHRSPLVKNNHARFNHVVYRTHTPCHHQP